MLRTSFLTAANPTRESSSAIPAAGLYFCGLGSPRLFACASLAFADFRLEGLASSSDDQNLSFSGVISWTTNPNRRSIGSRISRWAGTSAPPRRVQPDRPAEETQERRWH